MVANHRSCRTSRAYSKQLRAKLAMEASRLCMPCTTPGPSKSVHESARLSCPSSAVKTSSTLARAGDAHLGVLVHVAVGVAGDGDGLFPVAHARARCPSTRMGVRNTVPSSRARMVPLGLFHICFRSYSSTRCGVGRDGGALDRHAQALGGLGGIDGHLVVGARRGAQGPGRSTRSSGRRYGQSSSSLMQLPDDAGHLVAVHLHKRGCHPHFFHEASFRLRPRALRWLTMILKAWGPRRRPLRCYRDFTRSTRRRPVPRRPRRPRPPRNRPRARACRGARRCAQDVPRRCGRPRRPCGRRPRSTRF